MGPRRNLDRRTLDRRTVAICVVVALIAAIGSALVASMILGGDDLDAQPSGQLELSDATDIDPDRLLAVTLETPDGEATDLDAYRQDQPMLVNLWQSSCVPCIDEMPLLEQASKDNPTVSVIGVASQDRVERSAELATQTAITYPWVQDPEGNFFYESGATAMPTTLLLDTDGTVLATETGAFADQAELQAFISENLD